MTVSVRVIRRMWRGLAIIVVMWSWLYRDKEALCVSVRPHSSSSTGGIVSMPYDERSSFDLLLGTTP